MQISLYESNDKMIVIFADKVIVNKDSNDKINSIVLVTIKQEEEWEEHTTLAANDNGSILYKGVVYQAYQISLDNDNDDDEDDYIEDYDDENEFYNEEEY